MIVYCITNTVNGKKYIGMTGRTLEERWKSHCSCAKNGSKFRFHSAIRKYGEESFKKEVLFSNLNIELCRTIEEETIKEYNTMFNGYNAKPGGCGGWIVPDEKYDDWIKKISYNSTTEKNSRWSGYSDEFILEQSVLIFNEYENKEEFNYKDLLNKIRKKFEGIPKTFSKNRFREYGNSFKNALSVKLNMSVDELNKLANSKTIEHKKSLSNSNIGNSWFSNDNLKKSKQSKTHPGNGWYKGRKYGIKN
jgi:translation elongation factor EF-G